MDQSCFYYLDVSTGHITEDDNELLATLAEKSKDYDSPIRVTAKDCGYYVRTRSDFDSSEWASAREHLLLSGFSHSFLAVLDLAHDEQIKPLSILRGTTALQLYCAGVEFDRDGSQYAELTQHSWGE